MGVPAFVPDNGESPKSRLSLSIADQIEIVLCFFFGFFLVFKEYIAGRPDLKEGMGDLFCSAPSDGEIGVKWGRLVGDSEKSWGVYFQASAGLCLKITTSLLWLLPSRRRIGIEESRVREARWKRCGWPSLSQLWLRSTTELHTCMY